MEIVSINSSTKIYSILEEVITYLSERELYQPTFFIKMLIRQSMKTLSDVPSKQKRMNEMLSQFSK